jgi:hypothetical protein
VARLDHLDLVVSSIDRSHGRDGRSSIGLRARQSEGAPPHDRYAVGVHHVAMTPFRPENRGRPR